MMQTQRSRPAGNQTANEISVAGDTHILSAAPPISAEDALEFIAGAYVAIVTTTHGHHRRRVFLSLHSAEKAIRRARAAGHTADIVLCELRPIAGGGAV